jgi:hypothetical protein
MSQVKVLFVAANPVDTPPLRLDEEIRQIAAKIRAAEHRDSLELVSRWAARPDDLQQALLEHRPHVIHFSGHGTHAGQILLNDEGGRIKPVSREALVHLFRTLKDNLRVVLLNACWTRPQAEAIAEVVDCTIGMNRPIGDAAAIVFAASFYRALGFGRSVWEAFELGKAALLLEGIPEAGTPELLTRKGVDATELVLVGPSPAAPAGGRSEAPVGTLGRLALVKDLSHLGDADWATVVAAIPGAARQISRHGTIPEKVAELIRWAESPTGPGLGAVAGAFEAIRNP